MLTLFLFAAAAPLACKWTVRDLNPAALPAVMLYGSCFEPGSDVAQDVMKQDGIGPQDLTGACQSRRQRWLEQAVQAVRASGADDMLQEKRKLELQFRTIERRCAGSGG